MSRSNLKPAKPSTAGICSVDLKSGALTAHYGQTGYVPEGGDHLSRHAPWALMRKHSHTRFGFAFAAQALKSE